MNLVTRQPGTPAVNSFFRISHLNATRVQRDIESVLKVLEFCLQNG